MARWIDLVSGKALPDDPWERAEVEQLLHTLRTSTPLDRLLWLESCFTEMRDALDHADRTGAKIGWKS